MQWLLRADDSRAVVRVVCLTLGKEGDATEEAWCATTAKELQLLPQLVTLVKNEHCGQGEFPVEVLGVEGPQGPARPCTLVLTHDTVTLRDSDGGVILEGCYHGVFQVILSEIFPSPLVLKLLSEASVPHRSAEGDLIALVTRGLWVLSINRAKHRAAIRAEAALRQEVRARAPSGDLWGWLAR